VLVSDCLEACVVAPIGEASDVGSADGALDDATTADGNEVSGLSEPALPGLDIELAQPVDMAAKDSTSAAICHRFFM
jgi:hypothetical protein